MANNTVILRGDSTVRDINGDSITIFELEGISSNVIMGLSIRTLSNGEKRIRRTPIMITVHQAVNKSIFNGVKAIEAIELTSDRCSLALGLLGDINFYNGDRNFVLNDVEFGFNETVIIDDFTIYRESEDIKRQLGRLSKENIEVSRIKETRLYFKVTFVLLSDYGHVAGDQINIVISDHFLLNKWIKH